MITFNLGETVMTPEGQGVILHGCVDHNGVVRYYVQLRNDRKLFPQYQLRGFKHYKVKGAGL